MFFILFYYCNKRDVFLTNSECTTHSYAILIHCFSILQAKMSKIHSNSFSHINFFHDKKTSLLSGYARTVSTGMLCLGLNINWNDNWNRTGMGHHVSYRAMTGHVALYEPDCTFLWQNFKNMVFYIPPLFLIKLKWSGFIYFTVCAENK